MASNTEGPGPTGRWQRTTWIWLAALLVVCAVLRAGIALTTEPLLSPDSHGYLLLAREIADRDLSPDSGLRTPMYPLFVMIFGRDPFAVRLAQMGLGLLLTALLFWLGRRMTGSDLIATIAGAGYGLSFSQLFFENSILTETLTTLGVTISVLALLRVFDRLEQGDSPAGWVTFMGLTGAVTALVRPSFVFLPALLAAALLLKGYWVETNRSTGRKANQITRQIPLATEGQKLPSLPGTHLARVRRLIGLLIPALLPALILIGGWSAVNYARFGYFSPSTISGYTLTDHSVGFIEYAPDRYATIRDTYLDLRRQFGVQYVSVWHGVEPLKEALGLTTEQLSRVLMQMSLDLFARQPLRYAQSVWISWVQFWNAYGGARGATAWEGAHDPTIAIFLGYLFRAMKYIYIVFNAIFLAWTAAAGLALVFFRRKRISWVTVEMVVIAAVILTTSLLSSLMQGGGLTAGGSNRYAMPVQPLLVCVALAALWRLWQTRPVQMNTKPAAIKPANDGTAPGPDWSAPAPQSRAIPWILVMALAAKVALLVWLAYFGFPNEWGDMTFFKQPAYMALHTGSFTLPTALGHRPFADIVYAAYPPLYTYASWLGFKLFGFNVTASLGLDLPIHLILTGLLGWLLWRKTGRQVVAALFVLLSIGFLLPEGRPDEFAALLALLAIIACGRRLHLVCGLLLGASLAAQPTQAILGIIVCVCVDLMGSRPVSVRDRTERKGVFRHGLLQPHSAEPVTLSGYSSQIPSSQATSEAPRDGKRNASALTTGLSMTNISVILRIGARWVGIAAVMVAACGLIWLPSVATHLPEAWAQFRAHSTQRWEMGVLELLSRERLWAPFWISLLAFVTGGRPAGRSTPPRDTASPYSGRAMAAGCAAGATILPRRPMVDPVTVLWLSAAQCPVPGSRALSGPCSGAARRPAATGGSRAGGRRPLRDTRPV